MASYVRLMRPFLRRKWWLPFFAPTLFLSLVILLPFVLLVHSTSGSLDLESAYGSGAIGGLWQRALYNSAVQGVLSAILSAILGFPLGVFLGRYTMKNGSLIRSILILPFFLPSIVVVTAFISTFGGSSTLGGIYPSFRFFSTGLTGIVAVNTFFNAPLVAFLTSGAIERADVTLEESASTLGVRSPAMFRHIWGRNGILAALSGGLITFLYSFAGFTAPLVIGGPSNFTVEAWIYFLVKTLSNIQLGVLFSLMQSLILIVPVTIYLVIWSKERRVTTAFARPTGYRRERGIFYFVGLSYLSICFLLEITILGSLAVESLTFGRAGHISLNGYSLLFSGIITNAFGISPLLPFLNTIFYGILTSLIVTLLGALWITGKRRARIRPDTLLDSAQFIPLVIPSIVMALSISIAYGSNFPSSLTWVLIIAVQSAAAIPVVMRIISSGFASIPDSLWEAASTINGNAFFEVELPLAGSTIVTALMFGFAISVGEFTATNFLSTYTFMPISVEIYVLQSQRLLAASYALGTILLVLSVIFFYFIQRIGRSFETIR